MKFKNVNSNLIQILELRELVHIYYSSRVRPTKYVYSKENTIVGKFKLNDRRRPVLFKNYCQVRNLHEAVGKDEFAVVFSCKTSGRLSEATDGKGTALHNF